ncbi:isoprenyl transferase [Bacillus songklensis]|uniref:Isoprenyl transferase n=1 Tax=Bacillus songklensis TaxID=1069116 RepID=A0ABV8AX17_9BACI
MLKKFQRWKKEEQIGERPLSDRKKELLNYEIPNHIAIIMDGNGRWAQKRSLPRIMGHHEGMKVVRRITKVANELGVKALTLYAFSTENWKRPKMEVDFLMKLPEEFLGTFLPELIEENVQVRIMGNKDELPSHTLRAVEKAMNETKNNTGLILNFALNYGSRYEMVEGIKKIIADYEQNNLKLDDINEDCFSSYLMSKELPDPDLLIRTSGELRLSNFMLWQLAYTEFWFTDTLWPDFGEEDFVEAIEDFQNRGRRFGGI